MKKRILSVLLSLFIICGVVLSDYERVQAVDLPTAFWGTLEASRAWFTAMQAGGAFDRGISFNQFVNTTSAQWQEAERKVMQAYKLYLFYRYQIDVTEKFPNMTIEEVRQEALRLSTITYNSFIEKAINVSNTTKEGITVQDFKYWKEFCSEFRSIAQNGLGNSQIGDDTVVKAKILYNGNFINVENLTSTGKDTLVYNDNYYINNFKYWDMNINMGEVPTDRVRIPFFIMYLVGVEYKFAFLTIDINRLTGEPITISDNTHISGGGVTSNLSFINWCYQTLEHCNLPTLISDTDLRGNATPNWYNNTVKNYAENYVNNLSIQQSAAAALDWQYEIDDSLQNTAGQAIKDGNTKQSTKTIVKEGSVPVKRSSLKEEERNGEKVVSGEIGWDIPGTKTITAPIVDDTKEDEFIEDIGIIDVPEDIVIDDPVPGEIVIPGEEEVVIPVTPDVPIPIIKLLEIQYGPFYPTAMEGLEEFFPFCIPFDIAYCVNKFRVGEGQAPVLHIPILYPRALQGVLGESYDVTIDFNDYIALRNIIRYFILILFIVGLMTLTRNIIRG